MGARLFEAVSVGTDDLVGIFNFCPTLMLSVFKLLALRIALAVVPNCRAILIRVLPDCTV